MTSAGHSPAHSSPPRTHAPHPHRVSASYGPNILVASGSYLLLSISVTDSAGNQLTMIRTLALIPTLAPHPT